MEDLKTGDILLFSQRGSYLSCFIKCCTCSKYSHAAMILKDPFFKNKRHNGIYIIESTGLEKVYDCEDYEYKWGAQIRNFNEVYDNYNGRIYVRKLHCIRDTNFYKKLEDAHSIVHNRPYDANPVDWIKAWLDLEVGNIHKETTFFCSALVAFFYMKLGILPEDTPWTLISPNELGTESCKRKKLYFNYTVDPEVRIK